VGEWALASVEFGSGAPSLIGTMASACGAGRVELVLRRDCGGGVGSDFGGIRGDPFVDDVWCGSGEKGGVGASI
jgi:hypothetical protein